MKTFLTEKHNIPEGATHYINENNNMYFCWLWDDGTDSLLDELIDMLKEGIDEPN